MASNKPKGEEDWLGSNIKVFNPVNELESGSWSWPPSKDVTELVNKFLTTTVPEIKTCFSLEEIPAVFPESEGNKYSIAAHCLIYAPTHDLWKGYAMMQMRFDGKLGFPGGLIDPGEEIVAGLNRELVEEINLDLTKHAVEPTDFLFCHYLPNESDQTKSSRIRMFFSKEVTKSEYEMIEKNSLDAKEFGYESLGQFRVPLYIYKEVLGFPKYLSSPCFAGGATKAQLLLGLYAKKLLSFKELKYLYDVKNKSRPDVNI